MIDAQKKILRWFDQHGRKDLPWQHNKTPFRVWVSEIMLQQTQVTTVIPYFLRFMQRFPDLATLANATEDEVLHLWTGLGYYSRARNLWRTAKIIQGNYQGKFPDEITALKELPGIGLSTAGAILAIAFEKRAVILDGNVKRVLTRLFGITAWPGEKKVTENLWEIANKLTPNNRVADYTQAIMDLGATLCVRGKPECGRCPLKNNCKAHELGIEKQLPRSKPQKTIPVRETTFLLLRDREFILLEKRPPAGVWANLWGFPEYKDEFLLHQIKKFIAASFHFEIKKIQKLDAFRHTFSHFHLDILPVLAVGTRKKNFVQENNRFLWYDLNNPAEIGLPAPVKKLIHPTF